mgnify:CR=1 FL=1
MEKGPFFLSAFLPEKENGISIKLAHEEKQSSKKEIQAFSGMTNTVAEGTKKGLPFGKPFSLKYFGNEAKNSWWN